MVSPNDPVPGVPDPIVLLERFIELWEGTWTNPNDPSHLYIEYYQYAKVIVATENSLQDDIACWLLSELDTRWDFDNDYDDVDESELDPKWVQLHHDIAEYLPGI